MGRTYPQEWLVRTKRVYWTETGALWANASLPTNPRERTATIESICQKLSDYITTVAKRDWHGVSVRTVDGAELITRATPPTPADQEGDADDSQGPDVQRLTMDGIGLADDVRVTASRWC